MKWSDLISFSTVFEETNASVCRSEGNRYYNEVTKMITAPSFRRMMHKSVLYPSESRTRNQNSYVMELTSCARKISENIFIAGERTGHDDLPADAMGYFAADVVTMAAMLRCCGRPPYGYSGEKAVREWFSDNALCYFSDNSTCKVSDTEWMKRDLEFFSGNGHAVRHALRYCDRGINVTYPLIKIISDSDYVREYGTFFSEREYIREAEKKTGTSGRIHPLSYILSAARGITVLITSLDDAAMADGIMCRQILSLARNENCCDEETDPEEYQNLAFAVNQLSEGYRELRSDPFASDEYNVISIWLSGIRDSLCRAAAESFRDNYDSIMNGEFKGVLTKRSPMRTVVKMLEMLYDRLVWRSPTMTAVQMRTKVRINALMDLFVKPAAESFSQNDDEFLSEKPIRLIPSEYKKVYLQTSAGKTGTERLYLRMLMGTDHICDLTEDEAEDIIRKFGMGIL